MESVQAPITVMQRYEWKYILSAEQTAFFCERLKDDGTPETMPYGAVVYPKDTTADGIALPLS